MAPPIPDRWIPYKACGNVIEGTRIICFKVPLRENVQKGNPQIKEIWDIPTLLKTIPNLGAVIDLTNTKRYYNPEELLAAGIQHRKILIPGRIIPPKETVNKFMDAVDELLGKEGDFLIGVHCTHGLNRTGYMVCQYMRERLNIATPDAIARFEKARGYEIERENYKADLLGKTPVPPDLGQKVTIVKPIGQNNQAYVHEPEVEHNSNGYEIDRMLKKNQRNRPPNRLRQRNNDTHLNNYGFQGPSFAHEGYGEEQIDFTQNSRYFNRYNPRDFRSNWRDRNTYNTYSDNTNIYNRRNGSGPWNNGSELNWRNEGNWGGESDWGSNNSRWNTRGRFEISNRNNYRNAQY